MTFVVAEEVASTLAAGGPVVALETSVIGQGLPHPQNVECVERMAAAIAASGALAAWIGLVDGRVVVGLSGPQLIRFATSGEATKVARRDVPMALATRALGATTVSATIWAAHRAQISIAATGGIGGVHPGARTDVSADLFELACTPVLLVCSGPKSIVDPVLTAEKLEELGVGIVGYGVNRLPWFLVRASSVELEHRVDTPAEAAALAAAQRVSGTAGAVVMCNPVPAADAMDGDEVTEAARRAEATMEAAGVTGKDVTPYLLAALANETGGRSLVANLALLEDNARVAAQIAVALSGARSG